MIEHSLKSALAANSLNADKEMGWGGDFGKEFGVVLKIPIQASKKGIVLLEREENPYPVKHGELALR